MAFLLFLSILHFRSKSHNEGSPHGVAFRLLRLPSCQWSPAHPPRTSAAMATLLLRSLCFRRRLQHSSRPVVGEQLPWCPPRLKEPGFSHLYPSPATQMCPSGPEAMAPGCCTQTTSPPPRCKRCCLPRARQEWRFTTPIATVRSFALRL